MEKHIFNFRLYPSDAPRSTDKVDPSISVGETKVIEPGECGTIEVTVTKTVPDGYFCQATWAGAFCSAGWDEPCRECDDCVSIGELE